MNFISDENRKIHEEYLRELRLKMSIFEASYPSISGKDCREILRADIRRDERLRAARLRAEIASHELFFSSFGDSSERSDIVRSSWGSEANFLYRIMCDSIDCRTGFAFVYLDNRNKVKYVISFSLISVELIFQLENYFWTLNIR